MTEQQFTILRALRHGALDPYQLGADTGIAPFVIRSELKALKRHRLVKDRWERRRIAWELTNHGNEIAWKANQLRIVR